MRHLVGVPVGHRIALEVAVEAVEPDMEQRRAAAGARPLDRLAGRLVDVEEVGAVDLARGDAEAVGAPRLAAADRPARGGRFGVAVVLGDEDHRQVPDLGEVVALEHRALVGGAVAVEADRDAAGAERLGGQRRAAGERRAGADDAVRAEHALRQVGDVHRAALAAAEPVLPPEDLEHHPLGVAALGDAMAVAAVGRGDRVAVVEVHADADAGGFLAGVEMHEAGNVPGREFLVDCFLEFADEPHPLVGSNQLVPRELQAARHGRPPRRWFLFLAAMLVRRTALGKPVLAPGRRHLRAAPVTPAGS